MIVVTLSCPSSRGFKVHFFPFFAVQSLSRSRRLQTFFAGDSYFYLDFFFIWFSEVETEKEKAIKLGARAMEEIGTREKRRNRGRKKADGL